VERGVAEHQLAGLRPFVVQMRLVFPGETDGAVDLDVALRNAHKCVRRVGLGQGGVRLKLFRARARSPHSTQDR